MDWIIESLICNIKMNSSTFKIAIATLFGTCPLLAVANSENQEKGKMNFLFITADDLNCSTVNLFGGKTPNLTPNIDSLACSGMYFQYAHVTTAVSQVSRGALATGRYPHNSGIEGFYHTNKDIPTLQELLVANGYRIGIMGKVIHSSPKEDTPWDYKNETGKGRDYNLYVQNIKDFIQAAQREGKPFYFMANSHDPHRPWEGSLQEKMKFPTHDYPYPSRIYQPLEVEVPGFLPDIPKIRLEVSQYTNSVKRLDDFVGALIRMLEEMNVADNTVVMFLSDNGMAMPFSKTNCYLHSTHTPWIVRWPGVTVPGTVDSENFISGIDYMPTILEIAGISIPESIEGRSFVSLLKGKKQQNRDVVFTQFMETSGHRRFPMRAVQDKKYGYIFNAWSDGNRVFKNESQSGLTWDAMLEAAKNNEDIATRINMFSYRVVEEFYDFEKDPDALCNLIDDPKYALLIQKYREKLEKNMRITKDPVLSAFLNRNDTQKLSLFMFEQEQLIKKTVKVKPQHTKNKRKNKFNH